MKHTLQILLSRESQPSAMYRRFLPGDRTRLTIIVPGDSVEELAIMEVPKEEKAS